MAKDQYKYFRIEARELLEGLSQAVLALERGENQSEMLARLLRLAHTLKGASRVVKQSRIADCAHAIEDVFAPYRDIDGAIPSDETSKALSLLDTIAAHLSALDSPREELHKETSVPVAEIMLDTVRVEIEEMDKLLEGVAEAAVQIRTLRGELHGLDHAKGIATSLADDGPSQARADVPSNEYDGYLSHHRDAKRRSTTDDLRMELHRLRRNFASGLDHVEAELAQVRDSANRLRLLPAASVFSTLERAVRDAAHALQKEVIFETLGGANRLDANVLGALRDALLHVVRNAVAHGIEPPQERVGAGKPTQGRVVLRVAQQGTRVIFVCHDDGRGLDLEAIRRVAASRGLMAPGEAASLGLDEAVKIILKPGITTAGTADTVAGRGIGLDVVRDTAGRLKGEVNIRSEAGKGTSLEISVPVSLSSVAALEVEAGGIIAAVPLDAVRQTMRLGEQDVAHSPDRDSIVFQKKVIPFLSLPRLLRSEDVQLRERDHWSAIVLEATTGMAAIGVDRLVGTANVIVRPLPVLASTDTIVCGASLNNEGDPQLILDPANLVTRAAEVRPSRFESKAAQRPIILVIDDSLTTRMLEQSILESAGYEVEIATSGEEALEKARAKQYGLFLVDVEMPGMSGFEFVSRTRADARLRTVPAILVTSRNSPEDRRRGEEAGARAYIVKGEFDQGYLLRITKELIG